MATRTQMSTPKLITLIASIITYTVVIVSFLIRMEADISLIRQKTEAFHIEASRRMEIIEARTKTSEEAINKLNVSLERTNTILERIEKRWK